MRQLYCDLDGVLGNFIDGFTQLSGKGWNDDTFACDQDRWDCLNEIPRFFARLPKMQHGQRMWDQIAPYDPWVLTACPREMPQGEAEKKDWCFEHFGIPHERVIVVFSRRTKKDFAISAGTSNVLIDDYLPNVIDWRGAGGIGIHHINVEESMKQLLALPVQS
jgi:5'(3')-deoxyribonucleotidase